MRSNLEYAKGTHVDDALRLNAMEEPSRTLWQEGETEYTARQLNNYVDLLAARFAQEPSSSHIAVLLENSVEAVCAILACLRAGRVAVPINTKYHIDAISYILETADIGLLVSDPDMRRGLEFANVLDLKYVPTSEQPSFDLGVRHLDELALMYFTSGSTGPPKGVMVSHSNLMHGVDSVCDYLKLQRNQTLAAVLPMSFDAGLNFVLSGLNMAARIVVLRYIFPQSFARDLAKYDISGCLAVPSIFFGLSTVKKVEMPSLRFLASTGGRMDADIVTSLKTLHPQAGFIVMYGLTEAFRSTYLPPEKQSECPTSIGLSIPHATVGIVREDLTEAPVNEIGEIVHAGPLVSLGYWQAPDLTSARFRLSPNWMSTAGTRTVFSGDLGWRDQDGFFYFSGRKDRLIKSRGYRIAPDEIERAFINFCNVSNAVAVGIDDLRVGQKIVVFYEDPASIALDMQETKALLRPHLAEYMLPDELCFVKEFPLNANGKVDINKLVERLI